MIRMNVHMKGESIPMGLDFYKFTKIYKVHKFLDKSLVIFCKRAGKQCFVKMRIKLKIKL